MPADVPPTGAAIGAFGGITVVAVGQGVSAYKQPGQRCPLGASVFDSALVDVMKSKTHVPTRRRAPPDVVVTEADDGKEVTLHGDQKLVVRLSEQGGLPYIWWLLWNEDSNVNLAKQQPKPAIKPPPGASSSHPTVGGSVDRNFVFVPTESTESFGIPLALIYSTQQFDLKDPAIKIFKVRVTTKKK